MPNNTSNFSYNKPLVNNATDADLWGGYLNTNWDDIDADLPVTTSSKTLDFNVGATEFNYFYLIDSSGGTVTATLPAASSVFAGFVVHFKAEDITNTITIDGNGSETIDGSTTLTLDYVDMTLSIVCDGTNWRVLNKNTNQIGRLLQIVNTIDGAVNTGTTQVPYDDTIPQNTEGDEYMTLAITPSSTTNNLKIEVVFNYAQTGANSNTVVALFQDSTADALAAVAETQVANGEANQLLLTHYMAAGTTSSTTFKVRAGPTGSETLTFNGSGGSRIFGGVMASSITITEYLA